MYYHLSIKFTRINVLLIRYKTSLGSEIKKMKKSNQQKIDQLNFFIRNWLVK